MEKNQELGEKIQADMIQRRTQQWVQWTEMDRKVELIDAAQDGEEKINVAVAGAKDETVDGAGQLDRSDLAVFVLLLSKSINERTKFIRMIPFLKL